MGVGGAKMKSRSGRPRGSRGYGKRAWRRRQVQEGSRDTSSGVSAASSKNEVLSQECLTGDAEKIVQSCGGVSVLSEVLKMQGQVQALASKISSRQDEKSM